MVGFCVGLFWICGFRFGVLLDWLGVVILGCMWWVLGFLFCFAGRCLGLVICLCLAWVVWVCLGFDGWLRLRLFCFVLGCCLRIRFCGWTLGLGWMCGYLVA